MERKLKHKALVLVQPADGKGFEPEYHASLAQSAGYLCGSAAQAMANPVPAGLTPEVGYARAEQEAHRRQCAFAMTAPTSVATGFPVDLVDVITLKANEAAWPQLGIESIEKLPPYPFKSGDHTYSALVYVVTMKGGENLKHAARRKFFTSALRNAISPDSGRERALVPTA